MIQIGLRPADAFYMTSTLSPIIPQLAVVAFGQDVSSSRFCFANTYASLVNPWTPHQFNLVRSYESCQFGVRPPLSSWHLSTTFHRYFEKFWTWSGTYWTSLHTKRRSFRSTHERVSFIVVTHSINRNYTPHLLIRLCEACDLLTLPIYKGSQRYSSQALHQLPPLSFSFGTMSSVWTRQTLTKDVVEELKDEISGKTSKWSLVASFDK